MHLLQWRPTAVIPDQAPGRQVTHEGRRGSRPGETCHGGMVWRSAPHNDGCDDRTATDLRLHPAHPAARGYDPDATWDDQARSRTIAVPPPMLAVRRPCLDSHWNKPEVRQ